MAQKLLIFLVILTFWVSPALAGRSATKAFKITTRMPAVVEMTSPRTIPADGEQPTIKSGQWQTTETITLNRDDQAFMLRTTVIR